MAIVSKETKPGYKTTEFWVTAAALLVTTLQEAVGLFNITDPTVIKVQGIIVAAYAVARGLAKAGVPA